MTNLNSSANSTLSGLRLGAIAGLFILVIPSVPAHAQTWVPTGAPSNSWTAVACSADGSKLVATTAAYSTNGQIYFSHDAGTNWTIAAAPTEAWSTVTCSAEGDNLIALAHSESIYYSTNSGVAWIRIPPTTAALSAALSGDGKTAVMANYSDNIFISTNNGSVWNPRNTLLFDVIGAICSADGARLAAANNAGMITISTNGGINWSRSTAVGAHASSLQASADLTSLVAVVSTSFALGVATSANMGQTWTTNSLPGTNWAAVASSADGTRLVAVATGGLIYSSDNKGAAWFLNGAPVLKWQAVASSADGNALFAAVSNGGIWVRRTVVIPTLRIAAGTNGPSVSWIVPSTPVMLQHATALNGTWIEVTNTPTLNLSRLSYEVVPASPGTTAFYRLAAP